MSEKSLKFRALMSFEAYISVVRKVCVKSERIKAEKIKNFNFLFENALMRFSHFKLKFKMFNYEKSIFRLIFHFSFSKMFLKILLSLLFNKNSARNKKITL